MVTAVSQLTSRNGPAIDVSQLVQGRGQGAGHTNTPSTNAELPRGGENSYLIAASNK
jgi:hypothetical protein